METMRRARYALALVAALALSWALDHLGPMTRTVRDCALMFELIAGHDPRDATSSRRPAPAVRRLTR